MNLTQFVNGNPLTSIDTLGLYQEFGPGLSVLPSADDLRHTKPKLCDPRDETQPVNRIQDAWERWADIDGPVDAQYPAGPKLIEMVKRAAQADGVKTSWRNMIVNEVSRASRCNSVGSVPVAWTKSPLQTLRPWRGWFDYSLGNVSLNMTTECAWHCGKPEWQYSNCGCKCEYSCTPTSNSFRDSFDFPRKRKSKWYAPAANWLLEGINDIFAGVSPWDQGRSFYISGRWSDEAGLSGKFIRY